MFDYDVIEETDPSPVVRLNFQVDEKLMPVRAPTMRLPGRARDGNDAWAELDDTLHMFVKREGLTPQEITTIWEKEWKVTYAGRIRFLAPPDSPVKYLNPREDPVPCHPEVVRLDAAPSILTSLVGQLRQRDPLLARKLEETVRQREEAEARHAAAVAASCGKAPAAPAARTLEQQHDLERLMEQDEAQRLRRWGRSSAEHEPRDQRLETRGSVAEALDTDDLDDEEREILNEVSRKGYYHGRPRNGITGSAPQRISGIQVDAGGRHRDVDEYQQKWDRFDSEAFIDGLEQVDGR